jgi:CheY-like chemotaxis protein
MGLAVAQRIVKNHQGSIKFSSQPDKGAVVHIYLPRADEQKKAPELDDELIPRGNENLLLVEDEKEVALSLKRMLEKLGYRVTEMNQAGKSLDLIRENKKDFDLIIVDRLMPEMSGMDMAQELKSLGLKIPIILISGYVDSVDEKKAMSLGIKKLMIKPVDTKKMAQTVRKVLDRRT